MAMKYDPIMCMMVDDSVKMKDTNKYVEKAVQLIKEGKGPLYVLSALKGMGLTPSDANKCYAEARSQTGYRNYDNKTIDRAIRSCDRVTVKYDDAIGDTHTFFKETEEEAKEWIDKGKFPHGAAFNIKIDGKLYKKVAR